MIAEKTNIYPGSMRDRQRVVQQRVYEFIQPFCRPNIWGKYKPLSPAFSLRDDLNVPWDEFDVVINHFFLLFHVDADGYEHLAHFPEDEQRIHRKIFRMLRRCTGTGPHPMPLTLGMLVEAAVTGRWVGPPWR